MKQLIPAVQRLIDAIDYLTTDPERQVLHRTRRSPVKTLHLQDETLVTSRRIRILPFLLLVFFLIRFSLWGSLNHFSLSHQPLDQSADHRKRDIEPQSALCGAF
jgi:hypothetical protein